MKVLLVLVLFFAINSSALLLSATVAQVGTQVITSRDITIASAIDYWSRMKLDKKKRNRAEAFAKVNSENFKNQLSLVILDYLVLFEAESFAIGQISVETVRQQAAEIADYFSEVKEWKALQVKNLELESAVSRTLRAKNFIKYKTETMGLLITDQEVKEYYDKNRLRFGGVEMDKIKESIREYMSQKELESKLKDWVQALKKKYHVRMMPLQDVS